MTSRKSELAAGNSAISQTAYAAPKLVVFGNVAELTRGGMGSVAENRAMMAAVKHP